MSDSVVATDHPIGLITDWGGVLTNSVRDAVRSWISEERVDRGIYLRVMREWVEQAYTRDGATAENPVHALERGEYSPRQFEQALAELLRTRDGEPLRPEGLLGRMFSGFTPVEPMYAALHAIKAGGVRVGLLSNSWGNRYPRERFDGLFDAVVISCEVGMRKPEPQIFDHALDRMELSPSECVFVDDVAANVEVATEMGMIGVHHVDVTSTLARLERLFGVSLS